MKSGLEELHRQAEGTLDGGQSQNRQAARAWSLDCSERIDKLLGPGTFLEMGIFNKSDISGMD